MIAPLKILHVITGLGTGGAETALCRLVESLRPPHFTHCVAALDASGVNGTQCDRVRLAGAMLVNLGVVPSAPNPLALLRLRNLTARWAPHVAHGWMYHGNLAATLACSPIPLLWGIRQTLSEDNREKRLTRLVIRAGGWLGSRPKAIVYNSTISARQHEALGYPHGKSRVIANGIDALEFRPDPQARQAIRAELGIGESQFVVGHFARFHPMKDHATAMRAAVRFLETHKDAVFVFAGEGMDARNAALGDLIAIHGLAANVRLCGRRTDMARLTAAIDLGYSSSAWGEGFSNVIAESMACGVPCVATDVGAAAEIVQDGGMTVPPRDPIALSKAWLAIAGMDVDARRGLGEHARRRIVTQFSLAACAHAYGSLYRELAGDGAFAAALEGIHEAQSDKIFD